MVAPVGVVFHELGVKQALLWLLLVPHLQSSDLLDQAGLERQVVFALGLGVDILNHNVDRLSRV